MQGMNVVPGGLSITRTLHSAAEETANGAVLPCDDGRSGAKTVAIFQVSGISGDTITFKGRVSPDASYVEIEAEDLSDSTSKATTATADGIYRCVCIGLYDMIAAFTYSAGTVTVIGKACA